MKNLKVGDVTRVDSKYNAVITRVPEGILGNQYGFLYADGAVDEEDEDFLADNAELAGHMDGVEALLAKIAEFKNWDIISG